MHMELGIVHAKMTFYPVTQFWYESRSVIITALTESGIISVREERNSKQIGPQYLHIYII